ncbi:MAG: DUF1846 domain-containing protein [Lachnospiraceae bacterium]|jgi:uncharacterized protein (UPF0371 family)|nr:DUF1846 domain-containing protein [Lachnospiraceae bacterium]MEE3461479.1 DUF1846 domain-containing protein [Lachnospiraceae bacterium]
MKLGFDNDKYLKTQSEHIRERIGQFGGKLYLEFGGKLFDDHHAARVLPGFKPDSKITMLRELKDSCEIIIVINAADIEKNKVRGDIGITYDMEVLRLADAFTKFGLLVSGVVMTHFEGQPAALVYEKKLQRMGMRVYRHYYIEGYPSDIPHIVSDEGFGKNDYIVTTKPLVVVTAPGPGSGKMAACLSQLYHEYRRGVKAGYAKFETFPVWNLPLNHPVNLAYEAATADLDDVNMIDPFHLEAYGKTCINYNRDVEVFPVLNAIFEKIQGNSPYKSPTDMGVNMVGCCISDDEVVCNAAKQEIIRRYYQAQCDKLNGVNGDDPIYKIELLMKKAKISAADRPCVAAADLKADQTGAPAAAIQMEDGNILTGKTSKLLGATSAMLLNALKTLAGIADDIDLLSPKVIDPIMDMKIRYLGSDETSLLHLNEILIALSIAAVSDENAALAMKQLGNLKGLEAHSSVILSQIDENVLRKLGINITCEPHYEHHQLYHT